MFIEGDISILFLFSSLDFLPSLSASPFSSPSLHFISLLFPFLIFLSFFSCSFLLFHFLFIIFFFLYSFNATRE